MAILEVHDIHTYYGDAYVLQGLSLQLEQECRIAIIAHNHAMMLPYHANPRRMEFSERTRMSASVTS